MEDNRLACALCGGQLAVGTVLAAVAGGPIWAIGICGSLAAAGIIGAIKGL